MAVLAGLSVVLALLAVLGGYTLARQSDERRAAAQHAALLANIAEYRALFGGSETDPRLAKLVGQSTGLDDLRFEPEPAETMDRETQPVVNAQGRIVGFLTWKQDAPMTAMMRRGTPIIAAIALALVGFAGYSLWQLRRMSRALAESEDRARRVTEEDAPTGLPNQHRLRALLAEAMSARLGQKPLTFALFELSGLSDIDEAPGASRREEFLAEAIRGIEEQLPPGATLGRMGPTEFAVICGGDVDARALMRGIVRGTSEFRREESDIRLIAYAGYAQAPRDATSSDNLVRCARLALRSAAEKGAGSVVGFDPSIDALSRDQQFIRRELPRAIASKAMDVHYQPIVAADGSRIAGVEALLRWTDPERGPIEPSVFVPVAERTGLMDMLGTYVLRRALHEAKRWPELYIAVNLSPLQARDRRIVDLIRQMLEESGVEPGRLMLEVTEGVLIDNPEEMLERMQELRALGVRIALDDFGSGYSNLGYLQRFPFDKLKIDRSFVSALGHAPNAGVIIQAITALGRALGVTVVAEGVETEEQRVLLRLAGCDEMQGFLFARPAPAKSIDRLVAQRKTGKVVAAGSAA